MANRTLDDHRVMLTSLPFFLQYIYIYIYFLSLTLTLLLDDGRDTSTITSSLVEMEAGLKRRNDVGKYVSIIILLSV